MSSKSTLKTMVENFIEEAIESSSHIKNLIANMTLIAMESKKIADAVITLSKRLDDHETIILKMMESHKSSQKDSLDAFNLAKSKEKSSKPN